MRALHDDADFAAQLERTLNGAYVGSADLGEALATAGRVAAGDYDQWHDEWHASADAARATAGVATTNGDPIGSGRALLRAAEYDRQAYFFLRHDLDDERVRGRWQDQHDSYNAALALLPDRAEEVSIPFDPVSLHGYLHRPGRHSGSPRPTVIFPGGFDGVAEEFHKLGTQAAVARGWNALSFDGPGQGELLVCHRVAMRPDFETVLAPVIDWIVDQPEVDPDALVVIGRSLGGYLAPRGVAGDARIKALVCDPGQYDFISRVRPNFSDDDWQSLLDADPDFDAQLEGFLDGPRNREFWGARMVALGAQTYAEMLRVMITYTLDGFADRIVCPTLVTEGEGDFASQSQQLYDALTGEKRLHRFTVAEGGGGHCEGMGQPMWEAVTFGWLSEILARPTR